MQENSIAWTLYYLKAKNIGKVHVYNSHVRSRGQYFTSLSFDSFGTLQCCSGLECGVDIAVPSVVEHSQSLILSISNSNVSLLNATHAVFFIIFVYLEIISQL